MINTATVNEALDMIKNGDAVLVDVREPDEFKNEHIAYAMSVPLGSIEEGIKFLNLPPEKTILFQCLKGTRGQMACEKVRKMETCQNNTANIEGGIEAWKKNNFPVIGAVKTTGLTIMRQVQLIVGFLVALCVALGFMGLSLAFVLAGLFGGALFIAGLTGWCGLAMLLRKMPWNK
jgi:rhodanese-related sulfurtransferase